MRPNHNLVRASIRERIAALGGNDRRDWQSGVERVIFVLLEMRIIPLESAAGVRRMFLYPIYAQIEHIGTERCDADPASLWPHCRFAAGPAVHGGPVGGRAPVRRAADAVARMERAGRPRDRASLRAREGRDPAGRVAVLRALCEGDQCAQEGAQRRHPGAQLPDAGDLQLRRRFRRRFAAARARGHQGRRRHHRAGRRALHGRDLEDSESRQDRADPGPARRLLARLLDHRRGRAAAAQAIPRRAGGRLRQHLGRGEGRGRHHAARRRTRCRWSRASTPTP